jgi:hypothetical protein
MRMDSLMTSNLSTKVAIRELRLPPAGDKFSEDLSEYLIKLNFTNNCSSTSERNSLPVFIMWQFGVSHPQKTTRQPRSERNKVGDDTFILREVELDLRFLESRGF